MAIIPAEEKVFMVSNSTNTTYSGSAALKAMQQWYTMEDVTNTVRPYQVFTALLSQSGGDVPSSLSGNPLVIGTTYTIDGYADGDDFTNVGAPYNADGVSFIATGTIANSFEYGAALLYNTGAPVATVLENTIGNVWFTYSNVGEYNITSNGLFTPNKTILMQDQQFNRNDSDNRYFIRGVYVNADITAIATANFSDDVVDSVLLNTPIEIRIYN